ncbi:hypothetical protein FQR65_LT15063 [Abscondita terminalis]|nr:hypothetical protein FQR65_LT15063 [Abscondita terminalis]
MWSYEKDQERLLRLLQEVGTEVEPFDDESDEEEVDQEILSDHDSESEQSVSDVATRDEFTSMEKVMALAAVNNLEHAELPNAVPPRVFHHRDNPFETLSDTQFIKTYRLSKNLTRELIHFVEEFLVEPSKTSALDANTKILTTLNTY